MKSENTKQFGAVRVLVIIASLVIIIAGLKAAQDFFIPVVMALFLATISYPITSWLQKKGLARILAVLTTVLIDFLLIAAAIVLVFFMGNRLREQVPSYARQIQIKVVDLTEWLTEKPFIRELAKSGDEADSAKAKVEVKIELQKVFNDMLSSFANPTRAAEFVTDSLSKVAEIFATTFIVLILLVFMLNESHIFGGRLKAIFKARGPNFKRFLNSSVDIQRYLWIKTLISAVTGILAGLVCWAAGVDLPELWGIVAFALNFIPAVGSVIAAVPPMILALLERDAGVAGLVGLGYLAINGFLGNFLEPMLLGNRFGVSTLIIVLSVLFWGWVWGPFGMLLAVPLTMILKVILDNSSEFRWVSVAISKGSKAEPEEHLAKELPKPDSRDPIQADAVAKS